MISLFLLSSLSRIFHVNAQYTALTETGKIDYDFLDEQLGSLKDKVEIKRFSSAESVNNWWASKGYNNPPYTERTLVQEIKLKEDIEMVIKKFYDVKSLILFSL